jgi:hypothetical protein
MRMDGRFNLHNKPVRFGIGAHIYRGGAGSFKKGRFKKRGPFSSNPCSKKKLLPPLVARPMPDRIVSPVNAAAFYVLDWQLLVDSTMAPVLV